MSKKISAINWEHRVYSVLKRRIGLCCKHYCDPTTLATDHTKLSFQFVFDFAEIYEIFAVEIFGKENCLREVMVKMQYRHTESSFTSKYLCKK
jgi:hypothetical protein